MSAPAKGKFTTEIGDDVIREALESVKRHDGAADGDEPPGTDVAPLEQPAAPSEPADAAADEVATLRAQLEMSQAAGRDLMEKLREGHERMLRAVADLDNFKKRAQKEKEDIQRYGNERLLKEFLPVMDNLERALEHARNGADLEGLRTGITMTRKQFEDALARHGVKQFSAAGQPFDPRLHEAMQQVETSDVPPNHVVSELVPGYTLNDRLIRPALVVVSRPPEEGTPATGTEGGEGSGGDSAA